MPKESDTLKSQIPWKNWKKWTKVRKPISV